MKKIKLLPILLFLSVLVFNSCKDNDTEELIVKFSETEKTFDITIGETFVLMADTRPYGKVESEWYVNGELTVSGGKFSYQFPEDGEHTLKYVGKYDGQEISETFIVNVANMLKVSLSIGDETQVVKKLNETLKVSAIVEQGVGIIHKWEVDGVVKSTEAELLYLLDEVKVHKVKYSAQNNKGTWEKEFDVVVESDEVKIEFSIEENSTIDVDVNEEFEIVATVTQGGVGISHEWKVGDDIKSTTETLKYTPALGGKYTITYTAKNAQGQTLRTAQWLLYVNDGYLMLDDFETGQKVNDKLYKGGASAAVVEVVNNPLSTGSNTSKYVLKVTGSFASQQLNIYINNATQGIDISSDIWGKGFDRIRFKYYNANANRKVMWKYNGQGSQVNITTQPVLGQWSYGEIELTQDKMDALVQIHLRLNDVVSGSASVDDVIYIDDIEFYNSKVYKGY